MGGKQSGRGVFVCRDKIREQFCLRYLNDDSSDVVVDACHGNNLWGGGSGMVGVSQSHFCFHLFNSSLQGGLEHFLLLDIYKQMKS